MGTAITIYSKEREEGKSYFTTLETKWLIVFCKQYKLRTYKKTFMEKNKARCLPEVLVYKETLKKPRLDVLDDLNICVKAGSSGPEQNVASTSPTG